MAKQTAITDASGSGLGSSRLGVRGYKQSAKPPLSVLLIPSPRNVNEQSKQALLLITLPDTKRAPLCLPWFSSPRETRPFTHWDAALLLNRVLPRSWHASLHASLAGKVVGSVVEPSARGSVFLANVLRTVVC